MTAPLKVRLPRGLSQHASLAHDGNANTRAIAERKRGSVGAESSTDHVLRSSMHSANDDGHRIPATHANGVTPQQSEQQGQQRADFAYDSKQNGVFPVREHGVLGLGSCGRLDELEQLRGLYRITASESGSSFGLEPRRASASRPLEMFHNSEEDGESPYALLERGGPHGPGSIPRARSRYYSTSGEYTWAPCYVLSFDENTEKYEIQWEHNGKKKKATRLNLVFDNEYEGAFKLRVRNAEALRAEMEALERYVHQVYSTEATNSQSALGRTFHERIEASAGRKLVARHAQTASECWNEIADAFDYASKQCALEHTFSRPEEAANLRSKGVYPRKTTRKAQLQGCAPLYSNDFEDDLLQRNSPDGFDLGEALEIVSKALPEAEVTGLEASQKYFADLKPTPSINFVPKAWREELEPPSALENFMEFIRNHMDAKKNYLAGDWCLRVSTMVEELKVKGGFEDEYLNEDADPLERELSPAASFRRKVAVIMQEHLREIALNSVSSLERLWRDQTPNDGSGLEQLDEKAPMFKCSLSCNLPKAEREARHDADQPAEETSGSDWNALIHFDPPLDQIRSSAVALFDEIVMAVLSVDHFERGPYAAYSAPRADGKPFALLSHQEPIVEEAKFRCSQRIQEAHEGPQQLAESFADLIWHLNINVEEYVRSWHESDAPLDRWAAELSRLRDMLQNIWYQSSNSVRYDLLEIDTTPLKNKLEEQAQRLRSHLMQAIEDRLVERNRRVYFRYQEIANSISKEPKSPEELDEIRSIMKNVKPELKQLELEVNQSRAEMELCDKAQHAFADTTTSDMYKTAHWPVRLQKLIEQYERTIQQASRQFVEELAQDKEALSQEVDELMQEVSSFVELGGEDYVDDRMSTVSDLENKIAHVKELAETYHNRDIIFGQEATEYPEIATLTKKFEPVATLWKSCAELVRSLPEWYDGPFTALEPDSISAKLETEWRSVMSVMKRLHKEPHKVAESVKQRIEDFQENMPLISALRNPGLRDRHWKRISDVLGFTIQADDSFSLSRALQLNLGSYLDQIQEVSDVASKEHSLEKALNAMQSDWSEVQFDYKEYRDTGTYVLKAVDEIQQQLDDQLVKTQSMRSSPYIGPLEERVRMWEQSLNLMQEIIDEWLKCQQAWMYLEPVFGSEDIMQQMPTEGRKFKAVDSTYRGIVSRMAKDPEVLTVTQDEELLRSLQEANAALDQVQKGLNDYLETKRLAFPRFFFLSNEELLEILAETKDPLRVQPYLKKIFEGINQLEFQDDYEVTAMYSEEGEKLDFVKTFNPANSGGNVEKWLTQCEMAMRETVKTILKQAHTAYLTTSRQDWILQWPGQVVINGSQIQWTMEVENSIRQGRIQQYTDKCTEQLNGLVETVRGKLTKLQRKVLAALVVIDVHARDVVQSLADNGVESDSDFDWVSQLRYYFEGEENDRCIVRMINASLPYGNEYLGAQGRLVITPLTDRCYRTLMGALDLGLGGAPEGPAGTGKTESVKDLAKAMAMHCVVFNCSDGLDYLAMGKFFKGIASSGAWACFDEFNRIDLEVLSVVAQQIFTIVQAKKEQRNVFEFEATKLSLRRTANVFITMNPGYAGRSELPDNLKALFRTVAMMIPDYSLIAEILLYSNGYREARGLARKLVATYRLCSEQLSSQSHYDYGMRAVISVLRAAGNLKQDQPEEDESILMLRSLRDVNAPKFLAEDIPLFEGILSDLFPGIQLPQPDYQHLQRAIVNTCHKMNLQPTEAFINKTLQLYEMVLVRHGLMLVGLPFGAKTSTYKALQGALTDLKHEGLLEGIAEKTRIAIINPKAVTLGQLYGQFDPTSHEWEDGILAKRFRDFAKDASSNRKWIVFDGPVDAMWIENMNTVLDDNKKLCLMSGEIIQMSSSMNVIFEVQDLLKASPATVSRCGMVYVEPLEIGWRAMRTSWFDSLSHGMQSYRSRLTDLTEWLVDPSLAFVSKHGHEIVETLDMALTRSLFALLESLLIRYEWEAATIGENVSEDAENEIQHNFKEETEDRGDISSGNLSFECLDAVFVFALIWSIGATLDTESRKRFDSFIRAILRGQKTTGFELGPAADIRPPESGTLNVLFPESEDSSSTIYDFVFDVKNLRWMKWLEGVSDTPPEPSQSFSSIIVTTVDTVCYKYLLDVLVRHGAHLLFIGPTGTGKTVYTKAGLNALEPNKYSTIEVTLSAQTTANLVQDNIEGKLDKRRKGVYGPPLGKRCVVFVDDLNMPAQDAYGSQPPIEILRMFKDHSGWYDRDENNFKRIDDMQFVAAMGPPGGGRNPVTARYLRHYNIIGMTEFGNHSMSRIYQTIMNWWAVRSSMPSEIADNGPALVQASIEAYSAIKQQLLPTPGKSHYLYNLRDISKVFQGMSMIGKSPQDQAALVRLWTHEMLRVFHDRLVDIADKEWYISLIRSVVYSHFNFDFDTLFSGVGGVKALDENGRVGLEQLRQLMFCDFSHPTALPDERSYEEVYDQAKLFEALREQLQDYNGRNRNKLDLVIFLYAAEHICRISRVIRQPGGNALLVGVGGSGRQSLSRLAAFMSGYGFFMIEVSKNYSKSDWHDDLRDVLKRAGAGDETYVFFFNDSQIAQESMLEDINNILNTGEVPNLFGKEDVVDITERVRPLAKKKKRDGSTQELFSFFVENVRRQLHIVLAFSPVGSAFRERLRKFPSLVNCCTIDWFSQWPQDALQSVAEHFLNDTQLTSDEQQLEEDASKLRQSVLEMCITFHQNVQNLSKRLYNELGRVYHITPTSYLELITTFKNIMATKKNSVVGTKRRYDQGLEKLYQAESEVGNMKKQLEDLQPQLTKKAKETEEMLEVIESERKQANEKRDAVHQDEKEASDKAASAKEIRDDCQHDLDKAQPVLDNAERELNTLSKEELRELKAMKNPPDGVKLVMEAVCLMLDVKPKRVQNPKTLKKEDDFWTPAQGLLNDPGWLKNTLKAYNRNDQDEIMQINDAIVKKVKQPYVENKKFDPEQIQKASSAACGLCKWVIAMIKYDQVNKEVQPKRERLAEAEREYNEVMEGLYEKRSELQAVEEKVQELETKLEENQAEKSRLEQDVDNTSRKLQRAEKLIGGLGGEKTRWQEVSKRLEGEFTNLLGDVLLSSGFVAYLGAFTQAYRSEAVNTWLETCKSKGIPCSDNFSLHGSLGDAVRIRNWTIAGLPNDNFSIENGIIMSNSRRWPLMIDPQGQANAWIKNMEKQNNLVVTKFSEDDHIRKLKNAIQFGNPVLLENVGEELDPALEPLLNKSTFKSGRTTMIRFGDSTIEYSEDFKLYITTKYRSPAYLPEVAVKVTLLNFMTTPEGLVDQLLGILVARESPEDERKKNELVVEGAENAAKLKEIEDRIIAVLSESEGNILEDEKAINAISESKQLSNDIDAKQKVADKTEKKIDAAREGYRPAATHVAHTFFCVADLANIEPMYHFALSWFIWLFERSVLNSEGFQQEGYGLENRIRSIKNHFTYSLYCNVCRSLFEKDKLLFSFLLSCKLFINVYGEISSEEFRFLLTGGSGIVHNKPPKPDLQWLSESTWDDILCLSRFERLSDFYKLLQNSPDSISALYESEYPHKEALPEPYESQVRHFDRLMVLRTIRPDKLVAAIRAFVEHKIGSEFTEPPTFDLETSFQDSNATKPLIFVLSPGSDPMSALIKYAQIRGVELNSLSMGQGQGPKAERMVEAARNDGNWVCLQNCHLAISWLPMLEAICESITAENTHENFRLWLTSYPSEHFPVSVLQNSIKMTNEAPSGIRANLLSSFKSDPMNNDKFLEGSHKPRAFKKLLFSLCFFHAAVQERTKFGPLGWNIPYGFNSTDLRISAEQLRMFLDEYEEIPLKTLKYTTGECNYGGRVTDDHDRRTLMTMLEEFYTLDVVHEKQRPFSSSGTYYAPEDLSRDGIITYINSLPTTVQPEALGLHSNADISKNQHESDSLLSSVLKTQSKAVGSAGQTFSELLESLASDIQSRLPTHFDIEQAERKHPISYHENMNTVLRQELVRFNRLLEVVHSTLHELLRALNGYIVMSDELDALGNSMFDGKIPEKWMSVSYPSLKPLGSYVSDLEARITMLHNWIDTGQPTIFWISGFFFTHAFLTGVLQNFARKYLVPIDEVTFETEFLDETETEITQQPTDGAYVTGIFIEGAKWDKSNKVLAEADPKVLSSEAPVIWLKPSNRDEMADFQHYACPLYRTAERRGVLTTTGAAFGFLYIVLFTPLYGKYLNFQHFLSAGHSSNFVTDLRVPTNVDPKHWVMRGTAALLSLST